VVLRNLQTMAESSRRLSPALKIAHPEIDWQGISDFRNVLVHDYLGLNLSLAWKIRLERLPELRVHIRAMIEESKA